MNASIVTDEARSLYGTVTDAVSEWDRPRAGSDVASAPSFRTQWNTAVQLGWTSILDERPAAGADEFVTLADAAGAVVGALACAGVKLPVRQTLVARYAAVGDVPEKEIVTLAEGNGLWDPIADHTVDASGGVSDQQRVGPRELDLAGRPTTRAGRRTTLHRDISRIEKYLLVHEIAGAVDGAAEHARRYCSERIQFGRPLNRIPAIRSTLGQLTVVQNEIHSVLNEALVRFDESGTDMQRVDFALSACIDVGARVANETAMTAHQLHGAMGITEEAALHHCTLLLWAALDEIAADRAGHTTEAPIDEAQIWGLSTPSVV